MGEEMAGTKAGGGVLVSDHLLRFCEGDREIVLRYRDIQMIRKEGGSIVVVHANGQTTLNFATPELAISSQQEITRAWSRAIVCGL